MLRPLALLLSAAATLFAQTLPDWSGTWQGTLVNLPARAGANPVDVALEIGAFPAKDGACSAWRTTYKENGAVRQVKDYRLCRGAGAEDLYVDEGGLKLTARLLGEVLVSPFKYDNVLLVSTTRLRGDTLEQEILTVDDRPAVKGPLPLVPRSVQRIVLRRLPAR